MPRMLLLHEQFRNMNKGSSSITEFYHSLKNIVDALADYDSKIDELKLVMQILRQLPPSYHSIVDVITNTKPFPSFLEAKTCSSCMNHTKSQSISSVMHHSPP